MIKETQERFFDNFVADMRSTMLSKGDDYANKDRLSNFKLAGEMAGSTAESNCFHHMSTKMARLRELITSSKEPNNESVQDTLKDLANYTLLLAMIRYDKDKASTDTSPAHQPTTCNPKPCKSQTCNPPDLDTLRFKKDNIKHVNTYHKISHSVMVTLNAVHMPHITNVLFYDVTAYKLYNFEVYLIKHTNNVLIYKEGTYYLHDNIDSYAKFGDVLNSYVPYTVDVSI